MNRNSKPEVRENLLECPLDPVHRIAPDRMLIHLYRCKKAILAQPTHPLHEKVKDMKECMFNPLHHLPSKHLDQHHRSCPNRKDLVKKAIQDSAGGEKPAWASLVHDSTTASPKTDNQEENWDDEDDLWPQQQQQRSYDPMKKLEQNPNIIFNKQGLTKSERRAHAQERRQMAADMENSGSSKDDDNEAVPPTIVAKQLRRPHEQVNKVIKPELERCDADGFRIVSQGRGRGWANPSLASTSSGPSLSIEAKMKDMMKIDQQQVPSFAGRGFGRGESLLKGTTVRPPPGFAKK